MEDERQAIRIGGAGALDVLGVDFATVEPDSQRVVAAKRDGQLARLQAVDLAVDVGDGVLVDLEAGEAGDFAIPEVLALVPAGLHSALALVFGLEVDFLLRRVLDVETVAALVGERAAVVPGAELDGDRLLRGGPDVAIQAQAVVAVAEKDVGPAVAVLVDPGGAGQVVAGFARQQVAVVAEVPLAEVGVELRPGGGSEQQVGQAVAVVVGPDRGAATGAVGQV